MQPVHSSPVLSGPLNIPGQLASGAPHSVHTMQLPGPHEREHALAASAAGPIPGHYFSALAGNPNSPHHLPNMLPHGAPHQFHHHPVLALNRMPHFIGQPELRIFAMNKRLQQRMDDCDSAWWEAFTTDFFEDDAALTVGFPTEDGPKRYTIGRTLIPRYFRSIFESGCGELYFNLRLNHEYFHHTSLTLVSTAATMTMNMIRGIPATVIIEGRLTLEFALDEMMRIRSWIFQIHSHQEMINRSMLGFQDPAFLEQLTKNITRYGMTTNTLNFFRLCVILEPMQELMSRQKAYSLTPRDCLKTTLFQKWQRMMPQEATRQPSKRRKRKGSAAATETNSNSNTGRASKRKQSPAPLPSHHIAQPGDVMIVGEPTLMGGDFGDEDERLITRLENTQYDAAMNANPHMHPNFSSPNETPNLISSPPGSVNLPMNSGPHSLPGVQFRTALSLGGPNSHPGMAMNDPVFSNSLLSTSQHPSGVPVSMFPGQQQQHPISTSARFAPHSNPVMVSQHYVLAQSKSSMSGSNTPSSRDFYQPPLPSSASDLMMHPSGRSSSTSSLVDGGSSLGGFPNCPSPNMPSRQSARFTPPGLPNGLGSVSSTSAQQNFLLPPEMVGCANSLSQMPISCSSLGSTPPTSYTPEAIDSTNMMHSSVNQASAGTAVKAGASPVIFSCMGSGTNGTQGTPEQTLAPMMVGPGCDQLPAGVLNEAEDIKSSVAHHVRSNSESV